MSASTAARSRTGRYMLNLMTCPVATGEPSAAFSKAVDVPVSASQEHAPRSASTPALQNPDRCLNENVDTSVISLRNRLFFNSESLLFKNGTDHTATLLFADSVKEFAYRPPANYSR